MFLVPLSKLPRRRAVYAQDWTLSDKTQCEGTLFQEAWAAPITCPQRCTYWNPIWLIGLQITGIRIAMEIKAFRFILTSKVGEASRNLAISFTYTAWLHRGSKRVLQGPSESSGEPQTG